MQRIGYLLEFVFFQAAGWLLRLLPLSWVQGSARFLGRRAYGLFGFRREIVLDNLKNAFPNEPSERLDSIARSVFENVATSLFELLWFPNLTPGHISKLVDFPDEDLFRKLHSQEKGVVIVTAHIGNWEFIPTGVHVKTGIPVHSVYKPQSNRLIDRQVEHFRTMFGNSVVPMGPAVREILRALQKGDAVLVAADQSAPKESLRMEFFGRSVPVFQGPAAFSLKTGAPMMAMFAIRKSDGRYMVRSVVVPMDGLDDSEESIRKLTERHVKVTEAVIREFPALWMWTHRRWKHADNGGEPV